MSVISVKYSELKDVRSSAEKVAKKYDAYSSSLYKTVYNKLNSYNGPSSGNISNAKRNVNAKLNRIGQVKDAYYKYAQAAKSALDACKDTDKRVKGRVQSLTGQFKSNHGIRDNWIENGIHNLITGFTNNTAVGRWLSQKWDQFKNGMKGIKDKISEWYHFDGGRQAIKGIVVGVLEVVIGVCAVVAALLSGGALLVVIAGVVAGVITAVNGVWNIINEGRGLSVADKDPALASRLHDENTYQDTLRKEATAGNVTKAYKLAHAIDIVNTICTVITVVDSARKLVENGLKWATSSPKISFKDYFKGSNYKTLFGKIKSTVKITWSDLKVGVKSGDLQAIKVLAKGVGKELKAIFTSDIPEFTSKTLKALAGKDFLKRVQSIKTIAGIAKGFIGINYGEDNTFKEVLKVTFEKIIVPATVVYKPDGIFDINSEGQVFIDTDFSFKLDAFYKPGKGLFDIKTSDGLKSNTDFMDVKIPTKVIDKLTIPSAVDITIPVIDTPVFEPISLPQGSVSSSFDLHSINPPMTDTNGMLPQPKADVLIPEISSPQVIAIDPNALRSISSFPFKSFVMAHAFGGGAMGGR